MRLSQITVYFAYFFTQALSIPMHKIYDFSDLRPQNYYNHPSIRPFALSETIFKTSLDPGTTTGNSNKRFDFKIFSNSEPRRLVYDYRLIRY
ncbi:unnamed protein product [Caenorhabditis angaria]|uniref:Uncharacterized protein n=1 Tax=Caenorhabditis angaria TaxID=860376 RepID=A0A9P1MXR4_9PELO|nr:unnamed protein product [Caenorhabditis angaria]